MTRSRRPNKPLKGLHGAAKVGALWRRVEDLEWAEESARKLAALKAGDVRQEMLEGAAKLEPWDLWALENDYEDDYDPGSCGVLSSEPVREPGRQMHGETEVISDEDEQVKP